MVVYLGAVHNDQFLKGGFLQSQLGKEVEPRFVKQVLYRMPLTKRMFCCKKKTFKKHKKQISDAVWEIGTHNCNMYC